MDPMDHTVTGDATNAGLKSQDEGSVKTAGGGVDILGYAEGGDVMVRDGLFHVRRHERWRVRNLLGQVAKGAFGEKDIMPLNYEFPVGPQEMTVQLAGEVLEELRVGNLQRNTLGIELEGDLYRDDGATGQLIPKYDGVQLRADNDEHPEMTASKVETATRRMENTLYPASCIEVAHALARATLEAYAIARIRSGFYVQASVTEGGYLHDVVMTDHPYIKMVYPIRSRSYKQHEWMVPPETKAIWEAVGVDFSTVDYGKNPLQGSINAVHYHTSIPKSLRGDFFDARIAYVYGLLRLTQLCKVINFALYNTRQFLSIPIAGVYDVRAYLRRALDSTHNSTIPGSANEFFMRTMFAVADGELHSFSRYPLRGQHERLRIKEFGTCEAIDGASNADLRLVLALGYFQQLLNGLALLGLVQVGGDETQVLPWLFQQYGLLFQVISALKGENSSFQQDREFNSKQFAGTVCGVSFAEQLYYVQQLLLRLEHDLPGMALHARIVARVIGMIVEQPVAGLSLRQYLGVEAGRYGWNGLNHNIITEYKSVDIMDNLHAQSEGTEQQAHFLLTQVRDAKDLLQGFFGIEE